MRLIDAEQLLDFIRFDERVIAPEEHTAQDIVMMIQTAPTIYPTPNDPLTLDELREMDGEPVYLPCVNCWVLVTFNGFASVFNWPDGSNCSAADWYNQVEPAYRRRTEEDKNATA